MRINIARFAWLAVAVSFMGVVGCAPNPGEPNPETHRGEETGAVTEGSAQVMTDNGVIIEGISGGTHNRFLGIRYAKPPVDELRFMPPQPLDADEVTTDATSFGNRSYQVGVVELFLGDRETPGEESEDCLFLNVYTPPELTGNRPVLVWIHGGAYQNGSSHEYEATELVENHDVVVVTINYRLGIFGFLNLSDLGGDYADSVNLGTQDQVAALNWVSDNVSAFGGDPENVTIFGQSAGGNAVFSLLATPSAEGLFGKAMALSGGEVLNPPSDDVELMKGYLKLDSDAQVIERLRSMTAEQLVETHVSAGFQPNTAIDGEVISQRPSQAVREGWASEIPILTGTTQDDGVALAPPFAPTDELGELFISILAYDVVAGGDPAEYLNFLDESLADSSVVDRLGRVWYDIFRSSALRIASSASEYGAGGWVYNFEVPTDHPLGITHGAQIPFLFRWIEPNHPGILFHEPTPENQQLSEQWSDTLVEFARTGSPNGHGLPTWSKFEADSFSSLRVDLNSELVDGPDEELLDIYGVR
ncbi:MAG: carboxylesterase family protein [Myxococcota bacterium]